MKKAFCGVLLASALLPVMSTAADIAVKVGIPRIDVAEYHRPYVALWLENETGAATTLSVWYDTGKRENGGTKWLKDMRQWWRKSGRDLTMPVDGISGATRPVGEHSLQFSDRQAPLKGLAPGQYRLRVEAAREMGGRELVEIPFVWPPKKNQQLKADGKSELGVVQLTLKP